MEQVNKRQIPILITWDVDASPHLNCESKKLSLEIATDLCNELGIQATFFVTADSEHATVESLGRIQSFGHEIGCHGLTHGDEENYDRMPETMQREYIEKATRKLEALSGAPIRTFRSPRVKTSATTLKLLAEYGYCIDSSVCSQRIDFISSNLINTGWLFAPRSPYQPHQRNAFKKGRVPIWEIPISAMIVPFISTSMNVFGLSFMKIFFRLLYAEARRTGKPIVYLAHPIEFILKSGHHQKFTLKEFTPSYIRSHGLLIRKRLYRLDKDRFLKYSRELFRYMSSFPNTNFFSMSGYHS